MELADQLSDKRAELRVIHRFALAQQATARRQRDTRRLRRCRRLIVKCLRALRYAARIGPGMVTDNPHCSHPLFSGSPEKDRLTPAPTVSPKSGRRRTFRERLRRR